MNKIINFCPTGTQTTRGNSNAPLTPDEIIEEVHAAYEIGISVVHVHARDEVHKNTYEAKYYQPIIEGIRKYCPDLMICVSLTGRLFPEFEKRTEVLSLNPDMGSLTMSSLNFPTGESVNSPMMIGQLINAMQERSIVPEIECFDTGMLNYAKNLIDKQILKPPHYFNFIFGNRFNAQADLPTIASIRPPDFSYMCFGGIGKDQLRSNVLGLLYADGVRIGLEDNIYFKDKYRATNRKLLKRLHSIMDELDIRYMAPADFKKIIKKP